MSGIPAYEATTDVPTPIVQDVEGGRVHGSRRFDPWLTCHP